MDHITDRLSDLADVVRQMEEDNIDLVTISLYDSCVDDGETIPARVEFEGATAADPCAGIVYDEVESVSADD